MSYILSNQNKEQFHYEVDEYPSFCAAYILYDFEFYKKDDGARHHWAHREDVKNRENFLKTIVRLRGLGSFFMADVKYGSADKYVFEDVPKKPWNFRDEYGQLYKAKFDLSPYYINPNTNAKVRHLSVIVQQVVEKAKK